MRTKIIAGALCLLLSLTLAGCGETPSGGGNAPEGTLAELADKIYAGVSGAPETTPTEITSENEAYYLGTENVGYTEGLAREPMMNAIPHSLVLIRLPEGADIEAAKKLIKDSADPYKWVCVGVEDDQIIVENIGSLVMLIMDKDAESYKDSFLALGK